MAEHSLARARARARLMQGREHCQKINNVLTL